MATRRSPRFKECRRLGVNVSGHPKAMNRANAPAFKKTHKTSEYGLQLIEKQKVKDVVRRLSMSEADFYRKQKVAVEALSKVIIRMEHEYDE